MILLKVNGWDVANAGLELDNNGSGWRDAPEYSHQVANIPGRRAATVLTPEPAISPRRLVVTGTQKAATMAALRSARDLLKLNLEAPGLLEISFGDAGTMDRVHYARLEALKVDPVAPAFTMPVQKVRIQLLCEDPREHDAAETVATFTGARVQCPVGTAPSYPRITLTGPVVNPVVTYRDADLVERLKMEFQVTLAAGEQLVVDCDRLRITDAAGVNRASTLKAAPDFVTLDPADAAGLAGPYPTLEVTPAPGAAEARYRRTWS